MKIRSALLPHSIKFLALLHIPQFVHAQILNPVHWSVSLERTTDSTAILSIHARLDPYWKIYGEKGPEPLRLQIDSLQGLLAPLNEVKILGIRHEAWDSFLEQEVSYYLDSVRLVQSFRIVDSLQNHPDAYLRIEGKVFYMVCDTIQCLPPTTYPFVAEVGMPPSPPEAVMKPASAVASASQIHKKTLLGIFLAGMLGGLLALLTPCVFPMIPLTVSYFTKQMGRRGVFQAFLYGISIVVIYTGTGFLVTLLLGPDAMNEMASNGIVNMIFFIVFVLFALSFFGAFELTLPARWATALDQMAGKTGWFGVFFMALTLTVVSFSCTGPIIGTLLVQAALQGEILGPVLGMLGFSVALALPFTLFALFPSVLTALPRSGDWMNIIRGSLGFIELALALKFLSNVDLAYGWNFLTRELFLVLWIVIFALWGLFLLGVFSIRTLPVSRDVSVFRLLLAIVVFAFVAYLVPGLWGAPLQLISGFPPPLFYREWHMERVISSTVESSLGSAFRQHPPEENASVPLPETETCPLAIPCFHDLEPAVQYARVVQKPLLLDFTGWTCVNCRKMEERVWAHPEVRKRLAEDFVLVSLYVDDKTILPPEKQFVSPHTGRKVRTIGDYWSHFQIVQFGANSQPYYVPITPDTTVLHPPVGYVPDVKKFTAFLDSALHTFRKYQKTIPSFPDPDKKIPSPRATSPSSPEPDSSDHLVMDLNW